MSQEPDFGSKRTVFKGAPGSLGTFFFKAQPEVISFKGEVISCCFGNTPS